MVTMKFQKIRSIHILKTTQLIATFITVYGILLAAMEWFLAGVIWAEALIAFFIIDAAKVSFYKFLNHEGVNVYR